MLEVLALIPRKSSCDELFFYVYKLLLFSMIHWNKRSAITSKNSINNVILFLRWLFDWDNGSHLYSNSPQFRIVIHAKISFLIWIDHLKRHHDGWKISISEYWFSHIKDVLLLKIFHTTLKYVIFQTWSIVAQTFSYFPEITCQTSDWQPFDFTRLSYQIERSIVCFSKCKMLCKNQLKENLTKKMQNSKFIEIYSECIESYSTVHDQQQLQSKEKHDRSQPSTCEIRKTQKWSRNFASQKS